MKKSMILNIFIKFNKFKKIFFLLIFMPLLLAGCGGNKVSEGVIKIVSSNEHDFHSFKKENLLEQGVENLRAENITKSIELLERFTSYYPNHAVGQFYMGKAYYKNKNYKESVIRLKKAYSLDKSLSKALLYLGKAYKETGHRKKAVNTLYQYVLTQTDSLNIKRAREEINKMSEPVIGRHFIGRIFVTDEVIKEKSLALKTKTCFTTETPEVYTSLEVIDAPLGTNVEVKWYYIETEEEKMEVNTASFKVEGSKNALVSVKKPFSGWPQGEYGLEIFVDGEKNASLNFYIF